MTGKDTTVKQGIEQLNHLSFQGKELVEKWPSCDEAQVTEALESVNELWEKFNKELMEFEKVMKMWTILISVSIWHLS